MAQSDDHGRNPRPLLTHGRPPKQSHPVADFLDPTSRRYPAAMTWRKIDDIHEDGMVQRLEEFQQALTTRITALRKAAVGH